MDQFISMSESSLVFLLILIWRDIFILIAHILFWLYQFISRQNILSKAMMIDEHSLGIMN